MTSVRDRLWLPPEKPYVGRITLELFDERSGRKQEHVEAENYATDVLVAMIRFGARYGLASRVGLTTTESGSPTALGWPYSSFAQTAGVNTDYFPSLSMPNAVMLTTASHAEDQSGDRLIRGSLTAWSALTLYSAGDTKRGQQNPTEGVADPTKAKFVFDWPTSSGNGTIRSVYWANTATAGPIPSFLYPGSPSAGIVAGTNVAEPWGSSWGEAMSGLTPTASSANPPAGMAADPDGVSYWECTYEGALLKRTIGTGVVVASYNVSATINTVTGLAHDGTYLWLINVNGLLRKFSTAGVYQSVSFTVVPTAGFNVSSMAYGGGHLWLLDTLSKVAEVDPATGSIIQSWTASSGSDAVNYTTQRDIAYVPDDGSNGAEIWLSAAAYTTSGLLRRFHGKSAFGGHLIGNPMASPLTMAAPAGSGGTGTGYILSAARQFFARSLLPADVVKSNTQTMKLTYEFDYA